MKHLPIPFEERKLLIIKKGSKLIAELEVELATSPIEHFQSLLYRKGLKENTGVVFVFENPALPSYVTTNVPFMVDTVQFNEDEEISHIGSLQPSKSEGFFLTGYQTKYLLMLQSGFVKKYKIISSNDSKSKGKELFKISVR